MNEDLINSAIQFLQDPGVGSAPLNKRVEFLQSKGLNEQEIEAALQRAGQPQQQQSQPQQQPSSNQQQVAPQVQPAPPIDYYGSAPTAPERSWKDYFIMATATAGVTYGLYQVFTKYLLPTIIPPSLESIDSDKQVIDEEFAKIDKILEQLAEDQSQIKESNDAKLKEIDIVIDNVNDFLSKYNKDKLKFDDDMRLMKLEIDNLSNSIEKNMGFTKNNIKDELKDINEELQSLKQLIKTRSEQSAGSARKLAPVSSIPSASDILKKNMAKVKSPSPVPEETPELSASVNVGGVTAGGIPLWQMQHKLKEEDAQKKAAEQPVAEQPAVVQSTPVISGNDSEEQQQPQVEGSSGANPSIPAWQLNASDPGADDKVKDTLKNVGVPAWQLNATPGN